jgi:hypothetical protein
VSFLDTQPVYDDLDRIERTNHRVRRAAELVAAIAPQLPPEALPALRGFLDDGADPDAGAADLLGAALAEVAGLAGRREVGSEVISPLRLLDDDGQAQRKVPEVLAGDGVGRFGGFLRPELRHRDFVTGWRSTRAWLPTALRRHGLPDADVGAALTAVDEHVLPPGYRSTRWSAARARLRLARTGTRAVRIAAAGAVRLR